MPGRENCALVPVLRVLCGCPVYVPIDSYITKPVKTSEEAGSEDQAAVLGIIQAGERAFRFVRFLLVATSLLHGFNFEHRAVIFLGQQVNEAVRTLADIPDALVVITEHRLAALFP